MSTALGIWWVSWPQPTEDFRPLTDPPTKPILGWWCSGYDPEDTPILCAAVLADSEAQAKRRVRKDWPEAKAWRFIEERELTWRPSDRFPLKYWEKARFDALSTQEGTRV